MTKKQKSKEKNYMSTNIIETWRKEFDEFLDENYAMSDSRVVALARETEDKILAEHKRRTDNT